MPLFNTAGKYSNVLGKGLQETRDFVLDRFVPRPEALFIKAMTGGAPTQTTMTDTELGKIKDAFQKQKQFEIKSDEEILKEMKKEYNENFEITKSINPEFLTYLPKEPTLKQAQQITNAAQERQKSPVTSLYPYGRDMRMAYGNLSVYPQPDGGVRIYDRWKVDKNLGGLPDTTDRVADLGEGGPIPALIYNVANKIGTYKPFDIDVTVPGEEWKNIQPISEQKNPLTDNQTLENQGTFLNALNNIYKKFNPKPNNSTSINFGAPIGPVDAKVFAEFMKANALK